MDALEPLIRKDPDRWLPVLLPWLKKPDLWHRRVSVNIIGRLPMKFPAMVEQCLELVEPLLPDKELDVKRAVSFAVRICAKKDVPLVLKFMKKQLPPPKPGSGWVLCDIVSSMGKKELPGFKPLLKLYRKWLSGCPSGSKIIRSIDSAVKLLENV